MQKTELLTVRAHHMKFLPELLRFGAIDFAKNQLDEYYFNFEINDQAIQTINIIQSLNLHFNYGKLKTWTMKI